MQYALWSNGRLIGHTDLDIHTVTPTMRQGFIEPTAEGAPLLVDATGVWRAIAEAKRSARARGEASSSDDLLVEEAMRRREDLKFELRDETGAVFDCDFIRIYDNFDVDRGIDEEMSDTEEEEEAEFQIHLSALSDKERDEALARRAEMDAEIDAFVAEMRAEREERAMFDSAWPPAIPADPRWERMQYLLQVHLHRSD